MARRRLGSAMFVAALLAALSACGGGGGDGDLEEAESVAAAIDAAQEETGSSVPTSAAVDTPADTAGAVGTAMQEIDTHVVNFALNECAQTDDGLYISSGDGVLKTKVPAEPGPFESVDGEIGIGILVDDYGQHAPSSYTGEWRVDGDRATGEVEGTVDGAVPFTFSFDCTFFTE